MSHASLATYSTTQSTSDQATPRLDFFNFGPEAIKAMRVAELRIGQSGLDPRLIELVRIRVSQLNGCAFCIDRHVSEARRAGETERRLATLSVWRDTPFFSPQERAALEWAEALTFIAEHHVPNAIWDQVSAAFLPSQLVDLVLLVNTANAWNRFAIAFRKLPV